VLLERPNFGLPDWRDKSARHPPVRRGETETKIIPRPGETGAATKECALKSSPLPEMEGFVLNPTYDSPNPLDVPFRRDLADHLELWVACPREKCRLAGACRGRLAACYDERRPEIIDVMTMLLYDGYLDEDGHRIWPDSTEVEE
jgi:hypothetical protein